jgi:subtilisin family serine protease
MTGPEIPRVNDVIPFINPDLTLEWLTTHSRGQGVKVAVIDSGIDASHPDLKGKVKLACVVHDRGDGRIEYEELPGDQSYDCFGHGSGVAGIILDLAPEVELISVKVLGENNSGSGEAMIAGIRWALNRNLKLLNLSLATTKPKFVPALLDLCEQAYVQDAILVVAKRNFGELGYPAMFSSVISVDCESFENKFRIVHYPKSRIEYGARGREVKVPQLRGAYGRLSGTSFATPHVTGVLALLLGIFPELRSCQAKAILDAFSCRFPGVNTA